MKTIYWDQVNYPIVIGLILFLVTLSWVTLRLILKWNEESITTERNFRLIDTETGEVFKVIKVRVYNDMMDYEGMLTRRSCKKINKEYRKHLKRKRKWKT